MSVALNYRELGSGGVPVLLIHGLFGAGDNLGSLARRLATTRRVLMLDLRNHGQSPHTSTMTQAQMAEDVLALLGKLDITRADIVGHSLGGKVAMQLALNHPECVRRLVVVDIAPVDYPRGHDTVFAALHAVDLSAVRSRRDAEAMMVPYIEEPMLRQFLLKSLERTDRGYGWRFNLPALYTNYEALRSAPQGELFSGPTLFVRGELSDYIAPQYEPQLRAMFPQARIETVTGTGHWVHGDNPEVFNQLVSGFLSQD